LHVILLFYRASPQEIRASASLQSKLAAKLPPSVVYKTPGGLGDFDDYASVMTENRHKADQIDDLQAKLMQAKGTIQELAGAPASKKARLSKAYDATHVLVRDTVKEKVWRVVKFISSEKQMAQLAVLTLKKTEFLGKFDSTGKPTYDGAKWLENNAIVVNRMLNDHRSYCQTAMKEVCITWMKDNNKKKLPSNTEFMKILNRDPGVDKKLFAWWWDSYMAKAAGSSKIWNKKNKYFGLLSTHAPPGSPKEVYITPSTEAWGLLLIENCRERWPKLMAIKEKNSARITYTKSTPSATKAGTHHINMSTDPLFLGTYTNTDSGQRRFGGWSKVSSVSQNLSRLTRRDGQNLLHLP